MPEAEPSFRAAAERYRRLAAKTPDPVDKQELHRIADQWLSLAQMADVAPRPGNPEFS